MRLSTIQRIRLGLSTLLVLACNARAQNLPETKVPTDSDGSDGDWLTFLTQLALFVFEFLLWAAALASLLFAINGMLTVVNDWRRGKAEVSDVGAKTVVYAVIALVVGAFSFYGGIVINAVRS